MYGDQIARISFIMAPFIGSKSTLELIIVWWKYTYSKSSNSEALQSKMAVPVVHDELDAVPEAETVHAVHDAEGAAAHKGGGGASLDSLG